MRLKTAVPMFFMLVFACKGCGLQSATKTTDSGMPDTYIGLVEYADAAQVSAWQADGTDFVIIDVRTEEEFAEDGHAPGAVLQSYYRDSKRRPLNIDFLNAISNRFDAGQKLLLMCSRGTRATQAAWELGVKRGFSDVHVYPGGYEGHHMQGYGSGDGWKAAGLPVVFPLDDMTEDGNQAQ